MGFNKDVMTHKFLHTKLFYTLIFVFLSLCFIGVDTFFGYRNLKNFIATEEQDMQANFDAQAYSLKKISDLIFTTSINTDEVISLYKQTLHADEKQKSEIRQKLWVLLKDKYKIFHKFQIQQLHFQLPNNESFLRFHKPESFGDDLTKVRATIAYVNRTHKAINGFEEGRIFNGFRHVYPLFDHENNYLGSVEVSSSALSYKKAFELSQNKELDIVLRKEIVENKVFDSQQNNYVPYPLNPAFSIEKAMLTYDGKHRHEEQHIQSIEKLSTRDDLLQKMANMEKFTLLDYHEEAYHLITFLPLFNAVSKDKVGYAIVFRENPYLEKALNEYLLELLRSIIGALVLTVIIYFIQARLIVQRELKKAFVIADEANRSKDTFLANMSHELRTPLNAIIGFSQILLVKKDTPESVKSVVEKINIAGKNLLTLVNTILDFSKIEAGEMQVHATLFSFRELNDEITILLEPMMTKKTLTFTTDFSPNLSLFADKQLLKQAIINLLSNAIKFSPENEEIVLRCVLQENAHLLSVCDHGTGIAQDKIATLFDPFTQVRENQNEAIKGTGLGLAIVKRIIELHNGKIWIESTLGKGSCFYVILPLYKTE